MLENPLIYVMVGIPASGKSTIRDTILNQLSMKDVVVISSDDFIEKYASNVGLTYSEVFTDAIKLAGAHVHNSFEDAIQARKNIIWDQTNTTIPKRRSILNRVPKEYTKVAVFVNTPLEAALERNSKRERKIPEHVIETMHSQLQEPSPDEGFDTIIIYN